MLYDIVKVKLQGIMGDSSQSDQEIQKTKICSKNNLIDKKKNTPAKHKCRKIGFLQMVPNATF